MEVADRSSETECSSSGIIKATADYFVQDPFL